MKECKNAQNKNQNQKPRNIVSTNVVVVVVNADAAVAGSMVSAVSNGILSLPMLGTHDIYDKKLS